jgi:hypothetical protein
VVVTAGRERALAARVEDELRTLAAAVRWGAADEDRVLAALGRFVAGDPDSWVREWTAAGGEAWAAARNGRPGRDYLHAAAYYGAALTALPESDGSVDEGALWERQRDCWDRAVAGMGATSLTVRYEDTTLPAYFVSAGPGRRPLVVTDHGGRTPTSGAWTHGGAAAIARGYHWMTFDGPGREAALRRQRLILRPDWEAVVARVADTAAARADVDKSRMAIIGLGHAGYGVPRALAFERRFAAAAVAPGTVDVARPFVDALPQVARVALLEGDRDLFERELHLAALFAPDLEAQLRRLTRGYDRGGEALFTLAERIRADRLGEVSARIDAPLLICDSVDEPVWPGQATELRAMVGGVASVVRRCTADEAIEDWLDDLF